MNAASKSHQNDEPQSQRFPRMAEVWALVRKARELQGSAAPQLQVHFIEDCDAELQE